MIERKIQIDAPIESVYNVIRAFDSYPEFLSTTHSAKERTNTEGVEVDFSIEVIKPIRYTLKFLLKAPTEVHWSLVRGDLMKKNNGAWILKSLGAQKTEAIYQIDIDFGWMVPKMIVEQLTKTQLPGTLEAFKKRAEALQAKA